MTVSQPASIAADVRDEHVTILIGDGRERILEIPDGSVDCVVTSPPYFGLRDYGTGSWEGGDPGCDHKRPVGAASIASSTIKGGKATVNEQQTGYASRCGKCGALRVDRQIGLEPTPEAFVDELVGLFEEIKRVISPHGTVKPKSLIGIPWRVALALQAAGWYLRAEVIWSKRNPMPESATDRPTTAHETLFMLTKRPSYYFDQEAVREPNSSPEQAAHNLRYAKHYDLAVVDAGQNNSRSIHERGSAAGRNIRSVWELLSQPYPGAHFATYPEELVERCLLASAPRHVCRTCELPRERIVERDRSAGWLREPDGIVTGRSSAAPMPDDWTPPKTLGWTDCGHDDYRAGVVLDPFLGSGTTGVVARRFRLDVIGLELNPEYAAMARQRIDRFYVKPRRAAEPLPDQETLFG